MRIIGTFQTDTNKLVGYGVVETASGDIPQLAVLPEFRRQGIASQLFFTLVSHTTSEIVKIINTDTRCEALTRFMEFCGVKRGDGQFEMKLNLE